METKITITITINGIEVSGHPGMTVLELARESGVEIPTLCDDPHLAPVGACRICLVEDERSGALLASCVTPIRPGLVINTRSPRVLERRKTIIKLLLASHPDTCMVCDKGNCCQLRKIATDMGIGLIDLEIIPQSGTIQEVNPFIERDLSKCILCAKCIRADQEMVVVGAIDYIMRGTASKPATLNDLPLEKSECTFCGTCVALCPTGALMEKEKTYRGATASVVDTVCPYCGCGCGISLEVKDNRIVRVRPSAQGAANSGTLCVRGSYGYDFVHSTERLTVPLTRVDGELKPVSWEEALKLVASEFKRIKKDHGADSLAVIGSGKCTNEENYLLQRFARGVLGTNNIDNGSRMYSSASRAGMKAAGLLGATSFASDIEKSPVIMIVGANPAASAPNVSYAIKRAVRFKGAKLLLLDPRQTGLSPFAHLWLKPKIGTDIALLNAMAKVIIEEKLFDNESAGKAEGFAKFTTSLEKYTTAFAEDVTGVAADDIRRAARIFAGAERAAIVFGNGINQQAGGAGAVQALANLALLAGRGGGLYALQRENNARGACEVGALPDFLPGYHSVDDAKARETMGKMWGATLPAAPGLTALGMLEKIKQGKVKGMLIMGENPVLSLPAQSSVRDALSALEFLVVTDLFLTETAKLAKVVLPAASFAEKEGTLTNFEGRVQEIHKAIGSLGESLPDLEIVRRLAASLGSPMPYASAQQVMDEIKEVVPAYRPVRETAGRKSTGESEESRRRSFSIVDYVPAAIRKDDSYPMTLQCGSILYQFGSGTRSMRASRLKKFIPQAYVEISRSDAESKGIKEGDMVALVSAAGGIAVSARLTDSLPAGMIFMPVSFPESRLNELFDAQSWGGAEPASLRACAVKLERIGDG